MSVFSTGAASRWLVEGGAGAPGGESTASRTRLFCFPHAGVGAAAFRGWFEAAAGSFVVSRVQLPGRENRFREPNAISISELVGPLAEALRPVLDERFVFFGHSLGATIAFEVARELRRTGGPLPAALFVAGRQAPQLPWRHPPIRHLDDMRLLHAVQDRYGSVPAVMLEDAELREVLTPTLRADLALVETYAYAAESPFDFPIAAFGGLSDAMVSKDDVDAWRAQTTGAFRTRMCQGGHLFVADQRDVLLQEMHDVVGGSATT